MPILVKTLVGTVVELQGHPVVRLPNGKTRALKLGDVVHRGDVIVTTQDGIVRLETSDATRLAGTDTLRTIEALESGSPEAATAAGGRDGEVQEGLRVERIAEAVGPFALPSAELFGAERIRPLGGNGAQDVRLLDRFDTSIAATEGGDGVNLGLPLPGATAPVTATVVKLPATGTIVTASGNVLAVGSVIAAAELPGLRYLPPADALTGTDAGELLFIVSDGGRGVLWRVDIDLTTINAMPLANEGEASGVEDATLPLALAGTDGDGSVASVTIVALPAGASLLLADGTTPVSAGSVLTPAQAATLLFVPPRDASGAFAIVFTVTDNEGAVSAPATMRVTLTPAEDLPVASGDSASLGEDTPIVLPPAALLGNDSDADGDALAIISVQGAVNGSVAIVGGNVVFTPAPDYSGPASFTYTVADGSGNSSTATVNLVVAPANDAPVAVADAASTDEDTPLVLTPAVLLGNDSDIDGDTLSITSAQNAVNGTVALDATGNVVFTPAPGYAGPASFAYTISDANGGSSTATVNVTVLAVNDAPVAADDLRSTPINTPLAAIAVLANDSDADGDALTVTAASVDPAQGSVVVNADGTIDFTPAADFTGAAIVSYTIADGAGRSDSATLVVNVGANTPPVGADATRTLVEDGSYVVASADFGFADADAGQQLEAVRIDTLPAAGTLALNGVAVVAGQIVAVAAIDAGQLRFTPAPDDNGAPYASFAFTVQDSAGAFDSAPNTVTFDVTPTDDAPVLSVPAAQTVAEDAPLVFGSANGNALAVADADGGDLTVTIAAANGTFTLGSIVGVVVSGNGSGNVVVTGGAAAINAALEGASFSGNADAHGNASLALSSSDGSTSDTDTVAITITPVADIAADAASTAEDTSVTIDVLGNDSFEDAARTITAVDGLAIVAGGAAVSVADGTVTLDAGGSLVFTPAPDFTGSASFAYTVSAGGTSETATVTVNVAPVNDPPVAAADAASTDEDTPLVIAPATLLANDSDLDGDTLSIASVQNASNGSVAIDAAGNIVFTPAPGYAGPASFAYTVADGNGGTSSATVNITVVAVNDAPVVVSESATTPEDTPISGNLLANDSDPDGDALSVTQFNVGGTTYGAGSTATIAGVGTLAIAGGGSYTFTPAPNYNGPVPVVSYTVGDGSARTDGTLSLAVTPANDAPDAADDVRSTAINTPLAAIAVLANDSDADGDTLVVTAASVDPAQGSVSINADGTLDFTPALNFSGAAVVSYTIADGSGGSDSATLLVNVGANAAPSGVDATRSIAEDGSYTVASADFGFADADNGQSLAAVRIDTLPAAGSLTLNGVAVTAGQLVAVAAIDAGQLRYAPAPDGNGAPYASFDFSVQDSAGAFDPVPNTLTFEVTPVADAPVLTVPASQSTAEDGALVLSAANGNAIIVADADGGDLTVTVTVGNGTLTLGSTLGVAVAGNGSGSVQLVGSAAAINAALDGSTFVGTADYHGSASLAVTTSDGTSTVSDSVAITVAPVADIAADSVVTAEDTAVVIAVLGNDSFENAGRTITAVNGGAIVAGGPAVAVANGSVALDASGRLVFTPAANYNGPAAFTYTVTSGGVSETANVDVTVTPANDAPVAAPDSNFVAEDATVVASAANGVLANDSDVDALDGKSVFAVSFGATAGSVGSALAGNYGTLTLDADGSYSYAAIGAAAQALAAGRTATEVFGYTMRDAAGATSSTTITFTITGTNDAPVALADVGSTPEDVAVSGNVLGNDSDADGGATLAVTQFVVVGTTYAAGATATIAGIGTLVIDGNGSYTFTPAANYHGPVPTATYTVSDGAATANGTLSLTVAPVNDAPVALPDTAIAIESGGAGSASPGIDPTGNVLANDTDVDVGDSKTVSAVSFGAAGGSVGSALAGAYGTLALNADGSYAYVVDNANAAVQALRTSGDTLTEVFGYTMRDAAGAASSSTLTVTIRGSNDAPVAAADAAAATEDMTLVVNAASGVLANDSDVDAGDSRTVSAVSFGGVGGTVGSALTGTHGTLTLNADGSYAYLADRPAAQALAAGQTATEVFGYTMRDAAGASSSTTITVTITGTNDAPVAVADARTTPEDTPTSGNVLGNDSDADAGASLAVTLFVVGGTTYAAGSTATLAGVGTLVINANGSWTFTPAANYNGAVPVATYTVSDGSATTTSTLTLSVTPVNDAPTAAPNAQTIAEDSVASGNVLTNDSDVEGNALTVTQFVIGGTTYAAGTTATLAGIGTLLVNANGSYTFTPAANYNGAVPVATYTVSDGAATATSTLTLAVTAVNDAPVNGVPAAQSTAEDTARVFSAANGNAITVADVDGGNLTTTIAVNSGTLSLGSTGGVTVSGDGTSSVQITGSAAAINAALNGTTFRPTADSSGSATLTVTTSDGSASDTDSVSIAVAAVADAPTLYAHLGAPSTATGTTLFSDNFNDGNFSTPAWTRVQLLGNTFAADPLSAKGQTEAQLFTATAWAGQTTATEWNNLWTVFNSQVHYNRGGGSGSDDAQGMLAYQNLSAADRARTAYSVSADMTANTGSQQNNGGGIVFGYQNANNYFLARWENPGTDYLPGGAQYNAYPGQANQLSLVQIAGGVPIDLGSFSNFSTPGFFNLRVDVSNLGIQLRVNDGASYTDAVPLINYAYGSVAGGAAAAPALNTVGLYTFDNDAGIAFDNVRVDGINYSYTLDLVATLNDTDGSETLSAIGLANLPSGVSLAGASGAIPISGGTASIAAASGVETTVTVTSSTPLTTAQVNAITGSVTATDSGGSTATTTVSVKSEILGTAGINVLAGTNADEWIEGRAGNDTLNAGAGNDVLLGGSGNDSLSGGAGADVFAWQLADRGTGGVPAIDTIGDFNAATPAAGGDVLDLRDLLQGEGANSLQNYLDFNVSGGNTEVRISSTGGFAGGSYSAASEDQRIVMSGVDIRSALGLGGGATDAQLIAELMNRGKLVTDAP